MKQALVTERFQERDLRAKVASESKAWLKPRNDRVMQTLRPPTESTGASRSGDNP